MIEALAKLDGSLPWCAATAVTLSPRNRSRGCAFWDCRGFDRCSAFNREVEGSYGIDHSTPRAAPRTDGVCAIDNIVSGSMCISLRNCQVNLGDGYMGKSVKPRGTRTTPDSLPKRRGFRQESCRCHLPIGGGAWWTNETVLAPDQQISKLPCNILSLQHATCKQPDSCCLGLRRKQSAF
ncbi:MAG: hypothetical protein QOI53_3125 [Verrucomicrobiota bacterium]|nr:hypothetical protein [Verrucomicrobiota bacterium]